MSVIGAGVSHNSLYMEDWAIPFNLASGITKSDEGKAVALDTSADATVKLAGDDDAVIGRLEVVEDRSVEGTLVGTVMMKGGLKFPVKSGETVNVGDSIQGAGSGEVKALSPYVDTDGTGTPVVTVGSHSLRNLVTEVGSGYAIALVL